MESSRAKESEIDQQFQEIDQRIDEQAKRLTAALGGVPCYCLLLQWSHREINAELVDDVFDDLRSRFKAGNERLVVVVSSPGGDIDAAYNLAMLFRRFGSKDLKFVVPRWAKSAATLLVCGGHEILMSPVAELGPLDPQIVVFNPLENRTETFSPLHIKSTLDLIAEQYSDGKQQLAAALVQRLQFPLTLGSFKKSLDISKRYLKQLLRTGMLPDASATVDSIAQNLTEGYEDHGAAILSNEAKDLGLHASELEPDSLEAAWSIHRLEAKKHELQHLKEDEKVAEKIKELPPELLEGVGNRLTKSAPYDETE